MKWAAESAGLSFKPGLLACRRFETDVELPVTRSARGRWLLACIAAYSFAKVGRVPLKTRWHSAANWSLYMGLVGRVAGRRRCEWWLVGPAEDGWWRHRPHRDQRTDAARREERYPATACERLCSGRCGCRKLRGKRATEERAQREEGGGRNRRLGFKPGFLA